MFNTTASKQVCRKIGLLLPGKGVISMPIKWSALRVTEAADMIEEHINAAVEPLECAREVAKAALEISNLPEYMGSRLHSLLAEIDRAIGDPSGRGSMLKSRLQAIRDDVPKDDLEAQKKVSAYGERQSLV